MRLVPIAITAITVLLLATCRQEIVEEPFEPVDSYERYEEALNRLDLTDTILGAAWQTAGRRAMHEPTGIEPPFEEILHFDPHVPDAVGYRFPLRRGRRVTIHIETDMDRYFADLYRLPENNDRGDPPVIVASRPAGENRIEIEARRDRYYLLRIQPELLRGGRFRVRIVAEASLAFPVEGVGPERILSFYGDPRGGGTRIHEGVDIFAPRGTPLLAVSDALVFRVGERDRGGNIVSLRDEERDLLIYYAHLDEQLVTTGQRVSAGDVIGTVGNTGNAIATPPHLHIGVYQGGWRNAVDPWEYLVDPPVTEPPEIEGAERVGGWYRLGSDTPVERALAPVSMPPRYVNRNPFLYTPGTAAISEVGLRDIPEPSPPQGHLRRDTAVQVIGAAGDRVRVRTVEGDTWLLETQQLSETGERFTVSEQTVIRDPLTGDAITELDAGASLALLGTDTSEEAAVVALESGRVGIKTPTDSAEMFLQAQFRP